MDADDYTLRITWYRDTDGDIAARIETGTAFQNYPPAFIREFAANAALGVAKQLFNGSIEGEEDDPDW